MPLNFPLDPALLIYEWLTAGDWCWDWSRGGQVVPSDLGKDQW